MQACKEKQAAFRCLEIAVEGFESAKVASLNGADRLELNAALFLGGLTPSGGVLRRCLEELDVPMVAMLRPRAAGFCYSPEEFLDMRADLSELLRLGADGIAFGILDRTGRVDEARCRILVDEILSAGAEPVFHRAFDNSRDPCEAVESLIGLGVRRILSSGQATVAREGAELLGELIRRYGEEIEILPGCGVNPENAAELLAKTGANQLHASCRSYRIDPTTEGHVSYAFLAHPSTQAYLFVDGEKVRALAALKRKTPDGA